VNNLSADRSVDASVTFSQVDGSSSSAVISDIPPLRSVMKWDLLEGHVEGDAPYALTVSSADPITPSICGAEFETWSQVCPGAMTAVNFYPGPLTSESAWWLGIGQAGGRDDVNTEWVQTYYLFNPERHR